MTYLAYAGIGSRKTPKHILDIMQYAASYLAAEGWTLHSGGAEGADSAFEKGVDVETIIDGRTSFVKTITGAYLPTGKEIYIPWRGFNHSTSPLYPENVPFTQKQIDLAARTHPAWHRCSPSAKRMHTRNVSQILGHELINGPVVQPVKFVVCWTEGGKLKGGTSQAIRIANSCDIPIVNFGLASDAQHLEKMVLGIDEMQKMFKAELVAA